MALTCWLLSKTTPITTAQHYKCFNKILMPFNVTKNNEMQSKIKQQNQMSVVQLGNTHNDVVLVNWIESSRTKLILPFVACI